MNRRTFIALAALFAVLIIVIFSFRIRKTEKIIIWKPKKEVYKIAIVLDDFGYTKKNLEKLKKIGVPMTIAVLPDVYYSKAVCSFANKNNIEVILHLPMEPEQVTNSLEKDTVMTSMTEEEIKKITNKALASVFAAKGASNHMGSKATKDERVMEAVLSQLKEKDMFFLDSVSTNSSVCGEVADRLKVPHVKRDIFIDNELNAEYIAGQMEKLEKIAYSKKEAVGIGHDRTATIDALSEIIPKMKEKGVKFVHLSDLVKKKER